MGEWQPIETAHMDGTHMLLATEGYNKVRIGWFFANAWRWDGDYHGVSYGKRPTHWMHVPEFEARPTPRAGEMK